MELKPVMILGANIIGKLALENFESNGVTVYGFLDDDRKLQDTQIGEATVFSNTDDDDYLKIVGPKCDAFVASDENKVKKNLTKMLLEERKVQPANCIHTEAYLSKDAAIGYGNLIGVKASISAFATLGSHNIIHPLTFIGTDAKIGDYVQMGVGTIVNAGVNIEDEVFIGSGVTIIAGVTIGKGASIGAGSLVIADVAPKTQVFGNPAKEV